MRVERQIVGKWRLTAIDDGDISFDVYVKTVGGKDGFEWSVCMYTDCERTLDGFAPTHRRALDNAAHSARVLASEFVAECMRKLAHAENVLGHVRSMRL